MSETAANEVYCKIRTEFWYVLQHEGTDKEEWQKCVLRQIELEGQFITTTRYKVTHRKVYILPKRMRDRLPKWTWKYEEKFTVHRFIPAKIPYLHPHQFTQDWYEGEGSKWAREGKESLTAEECEDFLTRMFGSREKAEQAMFRVCNQQLYRKL